MVPNETPQRRPSLFRSSFIFKHRTANTNLPSHKEYDETSTVNSSPSDYQDEAKLLHRHSKHGQPHRRPSIRIPPNTSPDVEQNWLTASPIPNAAFSPPFSRADVKGVVMPVKAERPLTLVGLPEELDEIHQHGEGSANSEEGVPLNELEIEPKRVGALQRVLSTRSQMWKRSEHPRPSGGDDSPSQGQGQRQGQDSGRRQGIVSALGRGLSLGSVRRLKSSTRMSKRRHTTGGDASVKENSASYGHHQERNGAMRHKQSGSIREETSSIQDSDNASLRRAETEPSPNLGRKSYLEGLLKRVSRS